jgi:hypothetical protein
MATTYEPIATTTLGSAVSSITLSSIPSTYTDLRIVFVGRMESGQDQIKLRINGDTGGNYSGTTLYGDGTSATSDSYASGATSIQLARNAAMTATIETTSINIFSYAGSRYKTMLIQRSADKNGSGTVSQQVAMWSSTSAINSFVIYQDSLNFAVGTTVTIYGIKAA